MASEGPAGRRVAALSRHLAAAPGPAGGLDVHSTSAAAPSPEELYRFLVRDNLEMRRAIFDFLQDPLYRPNYALSLAGTRELTSARVKKFVDQRFFSVSDYLHDPLKFMAALECLAFCDYSLAIKSGVHFTLCGGTICKLGTAKHHAAILPKMDSLELPGCFGMTELGHGSDVMGIETTAVYDPATSEFVINTPSNEASKFWIGGAANTAKICAVFAQLTVAGKWEGPHVFIVRMRDDAGNLMPGVRTADNGPKMGLNGVDNGQIWFSNVRVPRDALLDRYAQVDESGRYSSPIPSVPQRFGTMVGGLTTGRILVAQAAVDAIKIGVTVAIRYSLSRPQFGDRPIMSYVTHQLRLYPALATAYGLHLAQLRLKGLAVQGSPEAAKQVHVLSAGLKAAATWHRQAILQDCRESLGGLGVMSANRIGPLLNDTNVDVTFEGANAVMMIQVAKAAAEAAPRPRPAPPGVDAGALGLRCLGALLTWREASLAAELAAQLAAAGGGAKGAAAALDASLDRAVALGWASVDRSSFQAFVAEVEGAPGSLREPLCLLAALYGLVRVESALADYLAAGVLPANSAAALRHQILALCGQLNANGGQLALALCAGFGIPDHLLQAVVANGWRNLQGCA